MPFELCARASRYWTRAWWTRWSSGAAVTLSTTSPPARVDVLEQIAHGLSNRAVASELNVSMKAVEKYVTIIFRKLGLSDHSLVDRRVIAALIFLRTQSNPFNPLLDPRNRDPHVIAPTMWTGCCPKSGATRGSSGPNGAARRPSSATGGGRAQRVDNRLVSMPSSNSAYRSPPPSLALYMARSALQRS